MSKVNKQLIVFIKSPEPGKCKTRLIPYLTAQQACEFYKSLVINCMNTIDALSDIDIALYVYPDNQHPFIKTLQLNRPLSLHNQQGNNLGERMHHAIHNSLKTYKQCVLIGTDCPVLDAAYINKAFKALQQHDMVLGPAKDGGYVLIGATKIQAELFANINWGSDRVLQQSLNNNSTAGYNTHLLNTLWDIDTPEDYLHYQSTINTQHTTQESQWITHRPMMLETK